MNKKYDLCVFIGRFQPLHNGHKATLKYAATLANHVLVLIGSATGPRTTYNPWNFEERKDTIERNVHMMNLHVDGLRDSAYNDNDWVKQVGEKVAALQKQITGRQDYIFDALRDGTFKIAIIGHDKDHSSYYLNYFKHWDYIEMSAYPSRSDVIDSTHIRQLMFENQSSFTKSVMPHDDGVEQVVNFMQTPHFKLLQAEYDYIQDYIKSWSNTPHPNKFVTVDAVVEQSGHILLIQRGEFPGKGLWALPGGHINEFERIDDAVVRELREETKLKVPEKVLRGSITHRDVFDHPKRSALGRIITHAYRFKLDDAADLPKVKGADDAAEARWVSLAEFDEMQSVMFEDHWSIVKNMISRA